MPGKRLCLLPLPVARCHECKQPQPPPPPQNTPVSVAGVSAVAGLCSGTVQAGLLTPWDRALYLSVKEHNRFLSKTNWIKPYEGFLQTIVQRTFSGGIYFVLQGILETSLQPIMQEHYSRAQVSFVVGTLAGVGNGLLLNPLSVVKYHMWGNSHVDTFGSTSRDLWKRGGLAPFFKGVRSTVYRDVVFGITYEVGRHKLFDLTGGCDEMGHTRTLACNFVAAFSATLFSAPLNYVRNIKYATPPQHRPPSIRQVFNAHACPLGFASAQTSCGTCRGFQHEAWRKRYNNCRNNINIFGGNVLPPPHLLRSDVIFPCAVRGTSCIAA
eukprot:m.144686 g.144686  ORF g.144686 m.144686 type:complete len:325 (-) comp17201_c0_seq7:544-1518(-)